MESKIQLPADGIAGLKQNWKVDSLSGFLVFLLALPLSLGIAKASEFPPAMGVLTAIIGGLFVSLFAGSKLTIKGPAAGLIVICASAVNEMGGGEGGWHLALGAIVVAALIQVLFGLLKLGSLSDFFPHSAVHGMLAAIGLIIFSKQIHILLGVDPATLKGLNPIELFAHIPHSLATLSPKMAIVGIVSLLIIFGLPLIKHPLIKKIPAPLLVLLVTVPMAQLLHFNTELPTYSLVKIGDFWKSVNLNVDFSAIGEGVFWKFVAMFALVGSLESLLTVKAIDGLDPFKRKSNPNKDLVALGLGNALSGLLGGLPMISEVARSSANVRNGGRTRWSNFFHGLFLLLAMIAMIPLIEMIPNAALAAMLIAVGYRLASPNEFHKTYKIGGEQLTIFMITIIATLSTDLLIGVGAGILTKFIFHLKNGAPIRSLFKARYTFEEQNGTYHIKVIDSAIFSNLLGYKKVFNKLKPDSNVIFDFKEAKLVDHTFMELLHIFEEENHHVGGTLKLTGFEQFQALSNHPLAARKIAKVSINKIEIRLKPRQVELRKFAQENEYNFYPQQVRNVLKFKDFPLQKGNKILYEENVLSKYTEQGKLELSDITLSQGAMSAQNDTIMSICYASDLEVSLPDFCWSPEGTLEKMADLIHNKDIDFVSHTVFSKKYYLQGQNELLLRELFTPEVILFFESQQNIHVECQRNKLLIYKKQDVLNPEELNTMTIFAQQLLTTLQHSYSFQTH